MQKKPLNLLNNFSKSFGITNKTILNYSKKIGINTKSKPTNLKKNFQKKIFKFLSKKILGKKLKKYIQERIHFYYEIRSCRGIRFKKRYPIRGQRTHTNAQTAKKLNLLYK